MANANLRVVGHFEDANGKTLKHFGSGLQFLVTVALVQTGGDYRPDASAIKTVLANHSKVPGGATFVIDNVANLDKEANVGLLT